ncbi:MAG: phage Gp37/Gp68 family protein [Dehalococcoidia bacterium]|nr:phage Gp37/Gp68 family protein [Dehalococcoidia bacterium]
MNKTKIEWVKNPDATQGYTWNPITGCLNHINGMCKGGNFPCYAYKLAHGRLKERYKGNRMVADVLTLCDELMGRKYNDPFYPRFWPEKIKQIERPPAPSAWANNASFTTHPTLEPENRHAKRKARGIFSCDMSDLFGIGVPEDWTKEILSAIRINSVDRFYLLTKQPQSLVKWSPFPENCWVGVTIADGYDDSLVHFRNIEARLKFISFEPLLKWADWATADMIKRSLKDAGIGWLIIGQKTPISAKTSPKIEWIQEIVEAADKAGIPIFLKDNLRPLIGTLSAAEALPYYDTQTCELRQELPK